MGYDLKKFSAGTMDIGISARTMDFQGDLNLTIDVYNLTQGIQQGLAPRYGMSPVPGQADNETIAAPRLPGLRASESSQAGGGFQNRLRVLGVFPIRMASPSDVTQKITAYAWLVTTVDTAIQYFDIVVSSTQAAVAGGDVENASAFIYDGFGHPSRDTLAQQNYFGEAFVPTAGTGGLFGPKAQELRNFLQYQGGNFLSAILMSVTGPNLPMNWNLGRATAVGDATHAPSVGFQSALSMTTTTGTGTFVCGVPTEYNLQNFTTTSRSVKIFALNADGSVNIQYSASVSPSATTFKQDIFGRGIVNLDMSTITATKDTVGTTYSNTKAALVNDSSSVDNSSYKAILVAARKPMACIFQDGYRTAPVTGGTFGPGGKTNQWYDLTQNGFQPRAFASDYSEEGISTKTFFAAFPDFVRGTPLATEFAVALTGPNTGFLREQTVYEFSYSLFNKRLNFETNVGTPVKFQTGVDDFVALQIWAPSTPGSDTQTPYSDLVAGNFNCMFPLFYPSTTSDPTTGEVGYELFMNHLQYRFYYREEGTASWLPALFIDVPQFWFYPHTTQLLACVGAIAALPGGEPGGFNDYSPLAKDNYDCVVQYKDRAFWFSEKQINFSLRDNIFAYPGRNSISAISGQFKGGLVHNYPGQAEQNSRLMVFGTTTTYVARFTGSLQQANVQVSADTSAVFNIDGSDLEIDPWTNVTAFSYRSAVVAEGLLYWWGPQGVFRDDGVQTPTRISADIEPNLFDLYDPSKTDEIVANYNNQTKEIEWFFTPKTSTAGVVNRSLIYNVISQTWTRGQYSQQIDWLQGVNITSNIGTAGLREVIGTRISAAATVQRAYFFDQKNRSGDMAPTRDWVVSAVSTPSTTIRRLTLAAGYDATNFAAIQVGDLIALQQTASYAAAATTANDMIARVAAIDTGAGTIDITLPAGGTLNSSLSLTYDSYFPFWQANYRLGVVSQGQNGIPYSMPTNYWLPEGTNGYFFWLFAFLLAKMRLWASSVQLGWGLFYRCPTAAALIGDQIAFADNSDGNFQVYHQLRTGDDNHEGQGIKFVLSGVHIGHEWVLQYMEAHGTPRDGDPLKRFEG